MSKPWKANFEGIDRFSALVPASSKLAYCVPVTFKQVTLELYLIHWTSPHRVRTAPQFAFLRYSFEYNSNRSMDSRILCCLSYGQQGQRHLWGQTPVPYRPSHRRVRALGLRLMHSGRRCFFVSANIKFQRKFQLERRHSRERVRFLDWSRYEITSPFGRDMK